MNKLFGGGSKKLDPQKLPALHSFVDVTVMGRPLQSVSVEHVGPKEIVLGDVLGHAGESAVIVYQNDVGRFRGSARIVGSKDGTTRLELSEGIEAVAGGGAQKRSSMRLDTLVQGYWRFAPGGKGVGEFMKGSVRDISSGGCALIANRQFKMNQMLEIKLHLRSDAEPLKVLGEVVRTAPIPTSGRFSHGLRFQGLRPEEEHAIFEFINRKQTELRSRGLA
ncbi:MAG: flagellar brake protein [Vulcanimicrobiaceae bacterium]